MKWFSSTFFMLLISTFCVFIVLSGGSLLQTKLGMTSPQPMRNIAQDMSSPMMNSMLAMEVPQLRLQSERSSLLQNRVLNGAIQYLTKINPTDPWTIVASETPGMYKVERSEELAEELAEAELEEIVEDEVEVETVEVEEVEADVEFEVEPDLNLDAIKAFIYHSHNRESWVPELEGVTKHSDAFDAEINVTLLGDRLADRLQDLGVGAVSSNTDYMTSVKDYNWNFSYAYSLKTVQEAFAVHQHLEYFFDLHRDALSKDVTTAVIDDVSYAKVYFVIGRKNPNWEKNEALAQHIHDVMEAEYPGISRGILGKNSNSGHAEYNQSFSANSILIEIGGVENTLEESYRTVDILGSAIAEVIRNAQKQ